MPNDILSTAQVAEILQCSEKTVNNLFNRGHFPNAYKLDPTRSNSPLRIPRSDVLAYQERQRKSFRPAAPVQPKKDKKSPLARHLQEVEISN